MRMQKQRLLAQLAAARAHLLRAFIGMSDDQLHTVIDPESGWTPVHLLAHLGEKDWYFGQCIRHVGAKQLTCLGVEASEVSNHLLLERVGDWSLAQAIDYLTIQRRTLMQAIQDCPADQLTRHHAGRWTQGSVVSWALRGYWHDVVHKVDVADFRRGQVGTTGSMPLLMAALHAARMDLMHSSDLVDEADRATRPILGDWSLKDVIGHLADWHHIFIDGLAQGTLDQASDRDAHNQTMAATRTDQTWAQVWEAFESSHAALNAALQTAHPSEQADLFYEIGSSAVDHLMYHAAMLRREIEIRFPDWLTQL